MIVVGAVSGGLLLSVCTGVGLASAITVTQAIKSQDKIARSDPTYSELLHLQVKTTAQAKRLIPRFKTLERVLDNAATTVAHASAKRTQKKGQEDWVSGVRLVASGVATLVVVLREFVNGHKAAASSGLGEAEKSEIFAAALITKADKLLGLPSGD